MFKICKSEVPARGGTAPQTDEVKEAAIELVKQSLIEKQAAEKRLAAYENFRTKLAAKYQNVNSTPLIAVSINGVVYQVDDHGGFRKMEFFLAE